jgi:hypothetical protein
MHSSCFSIKSIDNVASANSIPRSIGIERKLRITITPTMTTEPKSESDSVAAHVEALENEEPAKVSASTIMAVFVSNISPSQM